KLNVIGNSLYDDICKELDIEIIRNGSLTIARNDEEERIIDELLLRAKKNGVDAIIIDKDKVLELEPNITKNVKSALYAKRAGIINPFELCVGLMENAIENKVEFLLNSEVINIVKKDNYYVYTNKNEYITKAVINCAGLYAD